MSYRQAFYSHQFKNLTHKIYLVHLARSALHYIDNPYAHYEARVYAAV